MNPSLPSDFPPYHDMNPDVGSTWRWYQLYPTAHTPFLLQCRERPSLWSFYPGGPNHGIVHIYPERPAVEWPEARAAYVAWLLTNGASHA